MNREELDRERIEAITFKILEILRDNYRAGPISRDRCYEALNALAAAAMVVMAGADGPGGEAEKFFQDALKTNFKS